MQTALGPTSLFRLPPELRLMIWELLLPDGRMLKARSSGASKDPRRSDDRRFVFGFDCKVSQPILSQICAESRQYLLDHGNGQFIFGLEGEAGFWWGPDDVLLFDEEWCLRWATPSLEALKGLDLVKNIALDANQARYIYYEYVLPEADETDEGDSEYGDQGNYHQDDDDDAESAPSADETPKPQSITLGYLSSPDKPHFLEYFHGLNKLTVIFDQAIELNCECGRYHVTTPERAWPISQFIHSNGAYRYVTFDRDSTNMDEAVNQVSKLRWLCFLSKGARHSPYCYYDDTLNDAHFLYDFCIDSSRIGPAYQPTRVTFFDMINDEFWAL